MYFDTGNDVVMSIRRQTLQAERFFMTYPNLMMIEDNYIGRLTI